MFINEAKLIFAKILQDNRQKLYTHRLLNLLDDDLSKKLLLKSLTNRDSNMTREEKRARGNLALTQNKKLADRAQ